MEVDIRLSYRWLLYLVVAVVLILLAERIHAAEFSADDWDENYWESGTLIQIWDEDFDTYVDREVDSFNDATGQVVITAAYAGLAADQIITWRDWDEVASGGGQQVTRAEWYAAWAGSDNTLGFGEDPARIWI